MNIVITGASRGIGLELATQALRAEHRVFAFARNPEDSPELQALHLQHAGRLEMAALDLDEELSVERLSDLMSAALDRFPVVDVLINNAGMYPKGETLEDFLHCFQVNSVAPLFVTRAIFSKLKKSKKPVVAHISSLMGSVSDNESGGSYAYRASKAALNMVAKTLAQDEDWLISVVIHPGWVKTRMGGEDAPTSTRESAEGIWKVIGKLKREDSGAFFDYEGALLPW